MPPGHVNMLCGSRAEVVSRQFCFLTLSSVFFFSVGIKAGGFEFGCVGCCLAVNESNCLLLSNSKNRERLKNFRNVDCVMANHNKVQDKQANLKTTN